MIDGRNFFDQPINSMSKTYENIRKIATGKKIITKLLQNNCNRSKQAE